MFSLRLHISPLDMWRMPWYDIVYLYKAYSDYVDEENKQHAEQQAKIEEEHNNYDMPDFSSYSRNMSNDIANMKNVFSNSTPKI